MIEGQREDEGVDHGDDVADQGTNVGEIVAKFEGTKKNGTYGDDSAELGEGGTGWRRDTTRGWRCVIAAAAAAVAVAVTAAVATEIIFDSFHLYPGTYQFWP